ncbi:NUDIX domain-containing protein [Candidatus Falkowbacteria bacterium]|nr:NUDIX domain-containing protein [Candidatus Falkowbacteria bacterium]
MPDELIDICDDSGRLTGERKLKSEAHRDGLWHRAAHVWIYNAKGEVLLQLRAQGKQLYPGTLDVSAAGHVGANEEPAVAAARELEEELGLRVQPSDLHFFKIVKNSPPFPGFKNNEFYYVYFLQYDGGTEAFKLQDEEVESVKFFGISQIEKDLSSDKSRFVPHGSYWHEILGELEKISKIIK